MSKNHIRNRKLVRPYLTDLVVKLAPKVGAKTIIEPEWGVAGQIIYPNGLVRSLRLYSLDLNNVASADIARDKGYAKFFIKKRGYPVAEGQTVFEKNWAKTVDSRRDMAYALNYAKKLGYPVIAKPNSQSQGSGVQLVWSAKELRGALLEIFRSDRVALIERYLPGKDYRIVVLDGKIISAYERLPLSVTGDGQHSILWLLKQKQKNFIKQGRDTKINFHDRRIIKKLKRQGYSFNRLLLKNKKMFLLANANLSTGGEALDVTGSIPHGFHKIAARLTREMGLRLAGVDIMICRGDIMADPKKCSYYIIEINAAPGLDHYVTTGPAQKKIVETMYLKILKALGKRD